MKLNEKYPKKIIGKSKNLIKKCNKFSKKTCKCLKREWRKETNFSSASCLFTTCALEVNVKNIFVLYVCIVQKFFHTNIKNFSKRFTFLRVNSPTLYIKFFLPKTTPREIFFEIFAASLYSNYRSKKMHLTLLFWPKF